MASEALNITLSADDLALIENATVSILSSLVKIAESYQTAPARSGFCLCFTWWSLLGIPLGMALSFAYDFLPTRTAST